MQKALQIESLDRDLRTSLWNALETTALSQWTTRRYVEVRCAPGNVIAFLKMVWAGFLKEPLMNMEGDGGTYRIRAVFERFPWNEVYDLVEFALHHADPNDALIRECNAAMERENAGYRIVGMEITPITGAIELESIETAMQSGFSGVDIHMKQAVSLLSDRKNPDYRNAIKEGVSAVESACRVVSRDETATLGQALKRIREQSQVHPAFEKALSALYGYSSDEGGIRHSLLEESTITFTDAKFMVVACSAFVNYLVGKVSDLRLPI